MIAGEAIFSLPFHVPRFFRPQVLAEFQLTNTALGDAFAVYGFTAMLAYFPGGLLADRFAPRALLTASLAATAAGGFYFATRPGPLGLTLLYGYWGITTILLLWGAMIRATREWGGALEQGRAFGLLDAGRGLVAALLSTVALALLRFDGLGTVILFYSAITLLAAILCWLTVPPAPLLATTLQPGWPPRCVWWQAVIVVCAYCGYKGLDYYALLGHQLLGLTSLQASEWFSATAYLRPVAAVAAGWVADRYGAGRTVIGLFALGLCCYALLALSGSASVLWWSANLLVTILAVYGLRGVYFALLEETQVDAARTGFAVGVISLVGYTPDIFFAPVVGRVLDAAPGLVGFRALCGLLAVISAAGWWAAQRLRGSSRLSFTTRGVPPN